MMTETEAIEKAVKMADDLIAHCKEHDLMEGIFSGVVVDGPRFRDALIKQFMSELSRELQDTGVAADLALHLSEMATKTKRH